ncbi:hypothetical protein Tdes44962_MAKER03984 [Teratosphaeria destructans]|uniref:Uncharacterized protein n=1 Tax=Teratosphaeria destructans TaxID=418781 RepID=A0A9W7W0H2_9PEZI|nr:hypothetical protein Tdes44962_MAKER03984 [Teratosphaeria destructans]
MAAGRSLPAAALVAFGAVDVVALATALEVVPGLAVSPVWLAVELPETRAEVVPETEAGPEVAAVDSGPTAEEAADEAAEAADVTAEAGLLAAPPELTGTAAVAVVVVEADSLVAGTTGMTMVEEAVVVSADEVLAVVGRADVEADARPVPFDEGRVGDDGLDEVGEDDSDDGNVSAADNKTLTAFVVVGCECDDVRVSSVDAVGQGVRAQERMVRALVVPEMLVLVRLDCEAEEHSLAGPHW